MNSKILVIFILTLFSVNIKTEGVSCPEVDGPYPTFIPHQDCDKYYECFNGIAFLFNCSEGLHFNSKLNVCDLPQNANCTTNNQLRESQQIKSISHTTPICPKESNTQPIFIPHQNCSKYYECSNGRPYLMECPVGLYFNPELNVCDRQKNVTCIRQTYKNNYYKKDGIGNRLFFLSKIQEYQVLDCPQQQDANPVYIPHKNCSKFYECNHGYPVVFDCSPGLYFNPVLNVCDNPKNVNCTNAVTIKIPKN